MKAKAIWQENMIFTGKTNSDFPILLDTTSSANNATPMELIAVGLVGCTAMDVISILEKKCLDVTQFEVSVEASRSSDYPRMFTSAVITYIVTGRGIDEAAVLRAIELSTTKYCSVHAMLEQAFPIDLRYEIYEDEGDGNSRLAYQGIWQELSLE